MLSVLQLLFGDLLSRRLILIFVFGSVEHLEGVTGEAYIVSMLVMILLLHADLIVVSCCCFPSLDH